MQQPFKPENDQGLRFVGRASEFSQDVADAICDRLIGGESLRTICRDEDMPAASTVFKWLHQNEQFAEQYARARVSQMEAMAEDILEIADDGTNDWMATNKGDQEGWIQNGEPLQRSRLRVDARKWLMSKMAPKRWGDKTEVEHVGKVTVQVVNYADVDDSV